MSQVRKICVLMVIPALLLLACPAVDARGGGSGGGHQDMSDQPGTGQQYQGRQQMRMRQRKHIQATENQQNQLRSCVNSGMRAHKQVQNLAQVAAGSDFNPGQARQLRDQLRNEVQTMQQEHHRFRQSLSGDQREEIGVPLQEMSRAEERMNMRLKAMDQELAKANPQADYVAEQARETERAVQEWQEQVKIINSAI